MTRDYKPLVTISTPQGDIDAVYGTPIPGSNPLMTAPVQPAQLGVPAPVEAQEPFYNPLIANPQLPGIINPTAPPAWQAPATTATSPATALRQDNGDGTHTINVRPYAQSSGFGQLSQASQEEAADALVEQLAQEIGPDDKGVLPDKAALRKGVVKQLADVEGNLIGVKRDGGGLSGTAGDVGGAAIRTATGLAKIPDTVANLQVTAGSGLLSALGVPEDTANNIMTAVAKYNPIAFVARNNPLASVAASLGDGGAGGGIGALDRAADEMTSATIQDERKRVGELIEQGRWSDLPGMIASAPGVWNMVLELAPSLIGGTGLARLGTGAVEAAGGVVGRVGNAAAIGLSQGALQGGQTGFALANDGQGPEGQLTGDEALATAASGAFTGVTSGVAGAFAPTLERALLNRVSSAAAGGTVPGTIAGARQWLQSIVGGAAAEGTANGAQGFVDQYLQGGIDANGDFSPDLAQDNATKALAAGAYGAAQGAAAGGAGGVLSVRANNAAVRGEQATAAEIQARADADAAEALRAAQPLGGPVNAADFVTKDGQNFAKTVAQLQRQLAQTGGGDAGTVTQTRAQLANAVRFLQGQNPVEGSPAAADLARFQVLLDRIPLPPVVPAVDEGGQLRFGNVPPGAVDPLLAQPADQTQVPEANPDQAALPFVEPGTLEESGQLRAPGIEEGGLDPNAIVAEQPTDPLVIAENQMRLALRPRPEDRVFQDPAGQLGLPGLGRTSRAIAAAQPVDPVDPLRALDPRNELQNTIDLGDQQGDIFNPDPTLTEEQRARNALERQAADNAAAQRANDQAVAARNRNEGQSQVPLLDAKGQPTAAAADTGRVNVANVQYMVEQTGLPPAAMFADTAWLGARNKQSAQTLRDIAQLRGAEQTTTPRELAIRELKAIYDRGSRLKADSQAATAIDSRRARAILDAMQAAEKARPLAQGEMGVSDLLSAGKLPAGNDFTLRYDSAVAQMMRDGDVAGALARAAESNSSNKLLASLAQMASAPEAGFQVEIVRAPIDVRGELVEAAYDPVRNVMQFTEQAAGTPYYIAHETIHALVQYAIDAPTSLTDPQRNALQALDLMYQEARNVAEMPDYARSSLPEFIAEAWSNPTVQARMTYESRVPGLERIRTAFQNFTNAIRRVLGLPEAQSNALADVAVATQMLTRNAGARLRADPLGDLGFVDRPRTYMPELAQVFARNVDADGNGSEQIIGTVYQRAPDDFVMQFQDGRQEQFFDSMREAATYTTDMLGGRLNQFASEITGNPAGTKLANTDVALSPVMTKMASALRNALGLGTVVNSPALNRVMNNMAAGFVDMARSLKVVNVNKYAILQEIDRVLGREGAPDAITDEFRQNEAVRRAATGRTLGFMQQLQHTIIDGLRSVQSNEQRFGDYMYARHVPERNAKYEDSQVVGTVDGRKTDYTGFEYNGLTGNEAAAAMMASLTPQERAGFEVMARRVDQSRQEILRLERDTGIIDTATYFRLGGLDSNGLPTEGAYQYYVPLLSKDITNAISNVGVTGRWTKAENPTNAMLLQLDQRMSRVQRARSLQTLLEALEANPLPDLVKIRSADLTRNKDGEIVKVNDMKALQEKSVYVPRDGKFVRMEINTNTRQGALLLKSLRNDAEYSGLTKAAATATGWLASMNTGLNPAFVLKTMAWDTWMTLANFQGAYDRSIPTPVAFQLSLKTLQNAARTIGPSLVATRTNKTSDPMYQLYQESGGGVNPGAMADIDTITERMNRSNPLSLTTLATNPLMTVSRVRETVQHYLHTPDDAIRSAGFKTYIEYKAGREFNSPSDKAALLAYVEANPEVLRRAVLGSKEQTGDFEMRGTGRVMPAYYAFFNAAMQGTRLIASLASNPQGQLSLMTTIALGAIAAMSAVSDPDDKDKDGGSKYARSASREQAMLVDGESGFQIPVPYELRPAFVFGNSAALAMAGKIKPSEFARDLLISMRDVYVPVSAPGGDDVPFQVAYMATPTAMQVLWPLLGGKDAFGKDTEAKFVTGPDGKRVTNPANYESYKPNTSTTARNITEALYTSTDGFVDFYPERLDVATTSLAGGIGRLITQATQPPKNPNNPAGFGDTALVQGLTAAYKHKANTYALTEAFETTVQDYEVALRQAQRDAGDTNGHDVLRVNPKAVQVKAIGDRTAKAVTALKVQGMSRSNLFQEIENAKKNGDENALADMQARLEEWYKGRDDIYGAALQQIQELNDD